MSIRPYLILTVILFIITSCSPERDCDDPVDCLPPITQSGANTAGCLVNGEVILPSGQGINTGSVLMAQYTFSGDDDDDFVFGLSIRDRKAGNKMVLVEIRNQKLLEGRTYELKSSESNSFGFYNNGYISSYVTNEENLGELTISRIDPATRTISGTFWFDAANQDGETVAVRYGRFDVFYY